MGGAAPGRGPVVLVAATPRLHGCDAHVLGVAHGGVSAAPAPSATPAAGRAITRRIVRTGARSRIRCDRLLDDALLDLCIGQAAAADCRAGDSGDDERGYAKTLAQHQRCPCVGCTGGLGCVGA